jgi:LL-diaminopimelate aminotransferase
VFAALDARLEAIRRSGARVVDLGRADPDPPVPEEAVAALCEAVRRPEAHRYPPFRGLRALREGVARWYRDRWGVRLDPETEVLVLAGSKAGLFHISLAVLDPGDVALVPDPCFPAYRMGAYFAGAEVVSLPLRREWGYLPRLGAVPVALARRARILFLNYPNNPTGAVAPEPFLREAVAFARRHGILLCHDLAYGETGYDGYQAPSVLAVEGARETAVEFVTWSKAFSMPGWRLGAAVGCRQALEALLALESHVGSGVFAAVQLGGLAALEAALPTGRLTAVREVYRFRRDRMVEALRELGFRVDRPAATPFLWFPCPGGQRSQDYAAWLLDRAGVALAPGAGFGVGGEGFLRLSLTASTDDLEEAVRRLRAVGPRALALGPSGGPASEGLDGAWRGRARPLAVAGAWAPLPEHPPDALVGSL